jgi:lipopolysaccharide transport system ATP-binding protein
MSKPIIEVKGISKRYKLGTIGAQTMRDEVEAFFARFKKPKSPATSHPLPNSARSAEFWALAHLIDSKVLAAA